MRLARSLLVLSATALVAVAAYGAGLGDDGLYNHAMGARTDSMATAPRALTTTASCGNPPTTNLAVWLDGRSIDGTSNSSLANNDPITTWQDLGSIGDDPTQATGTAKPTFIASCINGKACARFDGGDRLAATTASNFTFLSDGSDWTAYVVTEIPAANPNAQMALFATRSCAGTTVGTCILFDDRGTVPANERARALIGNGTANIVNISSADDAFTSESWHIAAARLDDGSGTDFAYLVDGVSVISTSVASYSASSASVLFVGSDAAPTSFLIGDVAQVLIYSAAHDDTARATVETWIECEYGNMPVAANDNVEDSGLRFAAANDNVERVTAVRLAGGA